jgi:ATP-dependent RNA helicase DHX57
VYSFKSHILDTLSTNQIILISGETGCGKSTQIGQYILEQELLSGKGAQCQILCTQPRRISAISLAQRVSYEQCQPTVGKLVGYKIRGESKYNPKETKLVFMTTGVILRMIQFDPDLQGVTHVIFDEVHERSMDGDLFLILLKNLSHLRPDLKIILMSATLNAEIFSSYFGGVPVVSVPGFTHPVQDFYLEDYVRELGFTKDEYLAVRPKSSRKQDDTGPWDPTDPQAHLASLIKESDRGFEVIYYDLIAKLVKMICEDPDNPEGAILIFLPGEFANPIVCLCETCIY